MIRLLVTYLEMTAPPAGPPAAAPDAASEMRRGSPSPDDYLALYRAIGEPVHWDVRLRHGAAELAALLAGPDLDVFVLRRDGAPVGLCEFDRAGFPEIELVHFGLVPQAQGRGLGRFLLDHAVRRIWREQPRRVWLHTDTDDHPRALATYERAGFRRYLQRVEAFPDDLPGALPRQPAG